jgi:hypothetical protein
MTGWRRTPPPRGSSWDGIKRLAVRKHNVLISQVQFLSMGQEREEAGLSYSARLRGKASLCKFTVACPHGCEADVSYQENIMAHQSVRGLVDPVVQEKILSKATNGTELTLQELIRMVEAMEMGKRSQALLTGSGGLKRVSEYRAAKGGKGCGVHPGGDGPKGQGPGGGVTPATGPKCNYCGSGGHGSSQAERAGKCPALTKDCNKCGKRGHFAHKCLTKTAAVKAVAAVAAPVAAPVVPEVVAKTGAISAVEEGGSVFHIAMSTAEYSAGGRRLEVRAAESDPQVVKIH